MLAKSVGIGGLDSCKRGALIPIALEAFAFYLSMGALMRFHKEVGEPVELSLSGSSPTPYINLDKIIASNSSICGVAIWFIISHNLSK